MRLRTFLALVAAVAVMALVAAWLGMSLAVFIALEPVRALAHLIGA